jgi:hypothetical protein
LFARAVVFILLLLFFPNANASPFLTANWSPLDHAFSADTAADFWGERLLREHHEQQSFEVVVVVVVIFSLTYY